MGIANFEALGIKTDLGKYRYKDEGYVDSIAEKAAEISRSYGYLSAKKRVKKDERTLGRCFRQNESIHIFYVRQEDPIRDLGTRAHEETHALDLTGRFGTVLRTMRGRLGVTIPRLLLLSEEVRAYTGSILALLTRGYLPEDIEDSYHDQQVFNKAWNAYDLGKGGILRKMVVKAFST